MRDRLGYWQQRNGCTSNSTVDSDSGDVHHTTWVCGKQNGTLQHWKVDENGKYRGIWKTFFVSLLLTLD